MDKIVINFFTPFEPFIVRFNAKIGLKNEPPWAEIFEEKKTILAGGLVWRALLKNISVNILAQGGSFFKPIFALKP